MQIILNASFPTLNEYIDAERTNKYKAAKMKSVYTNKVIYLSSLCKEKLDKTKKYDVIFKWYKPNNRIDHDNIAFAKKFILDGLQKSKIINGDSPKYINNFIDIFEIDKNRSYISCIVQFIPAGIIKKLITTIIC